MSHDWGVKVGADLPIETLVLIRDGLKSGEITLGFDALVEITPKVEAWQKEVTEQIIAAYDVAIQQRYS